jgi:hypothetical protein
MSRLEIKYMHCLVPQNEAQPLVHLDPLRLAAHASAGLLAQTLGIV